MPRIRKRRYYIFEKETSGGGNMQAKTGITPTTSSQTVTPDIGYDGLSSVQIDPIPPQYIVPSGTKSITANGTGIDVKAYEYADVAVSGGANLQAKTGITPTSSAVTVTPDAGYDGLSSVGIEAVVCENLTAANIVSGVTVKVGTATDDDSVASVTGTASGGGGNEDAILQRTLSGFYENTTITSLSGALSYCTGLTGVSLPELTTGLDAALFRGCSSLTSLYLPKLSSIANTANYSFGGIAVPIIVLPSYTGILGNYTFDNSSLEALDTVCSKFNSLTFQNCRSLTTIIIRTASVIALGNINVFNGTPFASGGAGGTIYIPKTLYDHLGDNSADDYQAATNWATIDAYGTITWQPIEGSYYETHYADGTLITP